jgi:hypothetical protein
VLPCASMVKDNRKKDWHSPREALVSASLGKRGHRPPPMRSGRCNVINVALVENEPGSRQKSLIGYRARAGLRNLRCVQDYSIEDTDHSDVQPNCFAMQSEQLTINSEGLK